MKRTYCYLAGSMLVAAIGGYLLLKPVPPRAGSGQADGRPDGDATVVVPSAGLKDRTQERSANDEPRKPPRIVLSREMDQEARRALLAELMAKRGLGGLASLLEQCGNDPEERGAPSWLVGDLKAVLAPAYFDGRLGTASQLLDVLGAGYTNPHRVVEEVCETFVNKDHPDKAFLEVLEKPPTTPAWSYKFLFAKAGRLIGPAVALGEVNRFDPSGRSDLSKAADQMIFREWLAQNPEQSIQYAGGLPHDSWLREEYPRIIVYYAADEDDFGTAEKWLAAIQDPEIAASARRDVEMMREQEGQRQKEIRDKENKTNPGRGGIR